MAVPLTMTVERADGTLVYQASFDPNDPACAGLAILEDGRVRLGGMSLALLRPPLRIRWTQGTPASGVVSP
jgi:hypothetical protein